MRKLIIQLSGGVGNQLFQYHAGFAVAQKYGAKLCIDDSRVFKGKYVRSNKRSGLRSSNLRGINGVREDFLKKGVIRDIGRINKWKLIFPPLKRTLVDTSPNGEIGVNLSIEDICALIPDVKTVRLRGNLQSIQLVQFAREHGCMPFFCPTSKDNNFCETIDELTLTPILGVHLRAKDYGDDSSMTKLTDSYYRSAINLALSGNDFMEIWIFTDSEMDARRKYGWIFELKNLKVVKTNEFSDLETLYVMSKMNKLIISNSTFSFWGGMFNSEGKIFAPEPWFRSSGKIIGDSLRSDLNLVNFRYPLNWEIIKWE
jgi:hypothetical protein